MRIRILGHLVPFQGRFYWREEVKAAITNPYDTVIFQNLFCLFFSNTFPTFIQYLCYHMPEKDNKGIALLFTFTTTCSICALQRVLNNTLFHS